MIRSLLQFAQLNDEQRRSILRTLSNNEYQDILDVLSIYPNIQMTVKWEGKHSRLFRFVKRINIYFLFSV